MSELLKIFEFTAAQARTLSKEQSVAGEPIVIGEVTVIPISKLSCGFTGGGSDLAQKKKADGIMQRYVRHQDADPRYRSSSVRLPVLAFAHLAFCEVVLDF